MGFFQLARLKLLSLHVDEEFRNAVLNYRYQSPQESFLESLWLNSFWTRVAEFYPRWLAPNLITLAGGFCIFFAYSVCIIFSPDLLGELPKSFYIFLAFSLFAYQTLDGSDGKQARRIGFGSALGELMDHGIDAVVTPFATLMVADTLHFGILSFWPWLFAITAVFGFFLSNMTLVHTNKQIFFLLDVMEIQTFMIFVLFVAGIFGVEIFEDTKLPLPRFLQSLNYDFGGILSSNESIDFTSGYVSLRILFPIVGIFGVLFNYPLYCFTSIRPYIFPSIKKTETHSRYHLGLLEFFRHMLLIHGFCALVSACVIIGAQLQDRERASSAMRSFAVILSCGFGDLMNRVLILRVGKSSLPKVLPNGIYPLIAFGLLAWYDEQVCAWLQYPVSWWYLIAFASLAIHQQYFWSAIYKLAKVLKIDPFVVSNVVEKGN